MTIRLLAAAALLCSAPALAQEEETSSPAYQAAARAYEAAERNDNAEALRQARIAAQAAPSNREYQRLLFSMLVANRQREEAVQTADRISRQFGADPSFDVERAGLFMEMERRLEARSLLTGAIASRRLSAAEERNARLTLADALQAEGNAQAALDALAPLQDEASYDVLSRRGFALEALQQRAAAEAAFEAAYNLTVLREERALMVRSRIPNLVELGRRDEARALFDRERASGLLANSPPLELAYLASSVGARELAREQFRLAERAGTLTGTSLLDAGYNAKESGANQDAIRYFRSALEADRSGTARLEAQTRLYVTQEITEIGRTVGGYVSVSRSPTGTFPGAVPGGRAATYAGGEIYWRPPGIGYRGGRTVEVFGRAYTTIAADEGATGAETTQGYVGVRTRPILGYDLVFEASHLFAIGEEAQNDWLLRAAYSMGEGGGIRLDAPNWAEWNLFAEAAQFLKSGQTIASLEGRYGRAIRLGGIRDYTTLTGFIGGRANYDSTFAEPFSIGVGPGLSLRRGFGANAYRSPWSILDLTLQYRLGLAGGDQAEGVYAGATLSY